MRAATGQPICKTFISQFRTDKENRAKDGRSDEAPKIAPPRARNGLQVSDMCYFRPPYAGRRAGRLRGGVSKRHELASVFRAKRTVPVTTPQISKSCPGLIRRC